MIQTALGWLDPVFSGPFGYVLIAIAVALDRGAFIGLVAPGDMFLALGGIYSGRGDLSLPVVIVIGAIASFTGENISFWLGRRYGRTVLRHIPKGDRVEQQLHYAEDFFDRHGGRAVMIGRYISVVGTFLPFSAGMSGMSYIRFLVFDAAAIAAWAVGVSVLGYLLHAQVEVLDRIVGRFGWALLAVVVLVIGGRIAWRRRDRIRSWTSAKRKLFGRR